MPFQSPYFFLYSYLMLIDNEDLVADQDSKPLPEVKKVRDLGLQALNSIAKSKTPFDR